MKQKWYVILWYEGIAGRTTEYGPFGSWDEAIDFVDGSDVFEVVQRD